jgi:hypothetical protein
MGSFISALLGGATAARQWWEGTAFGERLLPSGSTLYDDVIPDDGSQITRSPYFYHMKYQRMVTGKGKPIKIGERIISGEAELLQMAEESAAPPGSFYTLWLCTAWFANEQRPLKFHPCASKILNNAFPDVEGAIWAFIHIDYKIKLEELEAAVAAGVPRVRALLAFVIACTEDAIQIGDVKVPRSEAIKEVLHDPLTTHREWRHIIWFCFAAGLDTAYQQWCKDRQTQADDEVQFALLLRTAPDPRHIEAVTLREKATSGRYYPTSLAAQQILHDAE